MDARATVNVRRLAPVIIGLVAVATLAPASIHPSLVMPSSVDPVAAEADPALEASAGSAVVERDDPDLTLENGMLRRDGAAFTGQIVERHPDGSIGTVTPYASGVREGTARSFFANGRLRWERGYVAGREEGIHRGWYEDGTLHFRYPYAHGLLEGNAREWFPDGTLYRDFNYVGGHEEGPQRMWHEDGTVRANYVVKEGRRYGLMGAKGCTGEGSASWEPSEEGER